MNKQRGSILLAALMMVGITLSIALSIGQIGLKGLNSTRSSSAYNNALTAAEAAAQDMLVQIKKDPTIGLVEYTDSIVIADVEIDRRVTDLDQQKTIELTASYQKIVVKLIIDYNFQSKAYIINYI